MTHHTHNSPSVGGDYLPENSTYISPGCSYIVTITDHPITHRRQFVTDIRDGQLRRTTVPDYSGLRTATPATGVLSTPRLPVSPVPVLPTSTIAGLGRDTLIYNGGAPPYADLWPALTGHTTLTSSHFNSYPIRDL